MPPIRRRKLGKVKRHADGSRSRSFLRMPQSRGRRANSNTLSLHTVSRKSEVLNIEYREMLEFTEMGGDNGSTPTIVRINLNNPVIGGPGASAGNENIVVPIACQKVDSTSPVANKYAYNNKYNLSERLTEYFTTYADCIVTKSEAEVVVSPVCNQTDKPGAGFRSVAPYFNNLNCEDTTKSGFATYLSAAAANAMPKINVWAIRQQGQAQLQDTVNGAPPLETLKQGIPGMRMTTLNVTPNSKKAVSFKMKYTPKSQYGFSDWKDNKQLLKVLNVAGAIPATQKEAYMYVGIGGRHLGQDPKASYSSVGLPKCNVEVRVKYTLHFSNRYNIDGNNEPQAHTEL